MNTKIVKIYVLIVLVLVFTFPAFYFLLPSFDSFNRIEPDSYSGEYRFINVDEETHVFGRFFKSNSDSLLIFLPDGPGKIDIAFEKIYLDSLKSKYSLFFPDYRGVGKSSRRKSTSFYHLNNFVSDLKTIIDAFDFGHTLIVSHGFGTIVSQSYMQSSNRKNTKQILISPIANYQRIAKKAAGGIARKFEIDDDGKQVPLYFEMHGYEVDEEEVGFFGTSKILALMDFYKVNFVDTLKSDYIMPEWISKNKVYTYDELYSINLPSVTIGLMYSLYKSDLANVFQEISPNTILVFGENDVMSEKEYFQKTNNSIKIVTIPESGYYPYIENPNSIIDVIIER